MKTVSTLLLLLFCTLGNAQTATVLWTPYDNTNAIKSALNSSATTIYLEPGKVYQAGTRFDVPSGKTLDGQGSTIQIMSSYVGTSRPFISTPLSQTKNLSASVTVTAGNHTINYSGSGNLVDGQMVIIYGPTYATYNGVDYRLGWFSRIVSHTSSSFVVQHTPTVSFTSTAIKCWKANSDVTIKNLRVDARLVGGNLGLIGAEYGVRVKIQNCIAEGSPTKNNHQGIRMVTCIDCKAENSVVYNMDMSGAEAPGFQFEGHNDTMQYCRSINTGSGVSSAGRDYITTGLSYLDNEIAYNGTWTGMDMHANAQGEFARNKVWMTNANNFKLHTIHVRRGNTNVHDNICYYPDGGQALMGVYMFEQGYYNNTVINNTFYYKTVAPNPLYHNTTSLSATVTGETAYNNQVIQMTSIPAQPTPTLMYPDGNSPTADTGVVVVPPVVNEPCTTCAYTYDFIHFMK